MNDNVKSSILGTIFSVVGSLSFLELAKEFTIAILFGAAGALGGLLFNILVKYIKRKYNEKHNQGD